MNIPVYNLSGEKVKDMPLAKIFETKVSESALALYVNYLRNALRSPVANTKDRSEVSGGGIKPWKQKGTGRARHGSSRSPIWTGGGVTFGPTNDRNFRTQINKNTKKKVILSIIGGMLIDKKARVFDKLEFEAPKTKEAVLMLDNNKFEGKISLIDDQSQGNAYLSFRNIAGLKMMSPNRLNLIDLMSSTHLIISESALNKVEEVYTATKKVKKSEDKAK